MSKNLKVLEEDHKQKSHYHSLSTFHLQVVIISSLKKQSSKVRQLIFLLTKHVPIIADLNVAINLTKNKKNKLVVSYLERFDGQNKSKQI